MLVERTFSIVDNTTNDRGVCGSCPINEICFNFVDRESGEVNIDKINRLSNQTYNYQAVNYVKTTSRQAAVCWKSFPKYKIKETTPKEVYRVIGKGGNTIIEANSWFGMIGQYFITIIISVLIIALIAAIFCGIGSLFN